MLQNNQLHKIMPNQMSDLHGGDEEIFFNNLHRKIKNFDLLILIHKMKISLWFK
jgi:hypothetical protein